MNGIVGLVAFCVLGACFIAGHLAVLFWARNVEDRIEVLEWRTKRAERAASEANNLIRMSWGAERKLEARIRGLELRVDELEAEIADHRAFLNFVEDCAIEGCPRVEAAESGCDCCNPELD